MIATYSHIPVLAPRALELLGPALQGENPLLVDATLGLGGHTEMFLSAIPALRVLGIDRDPEALERIRYRAPLEIRELRSAVVLHDYAARLEDLPEVRAARARLLDVGIRRVVRVVVLLTDEDQLDADERLRRWALARNHLEEVRLLGYDVEIVPPEWVPLDLDLVVDAEPWARAPVVEGQVREALEGPGGPFDPDTLGLGGDVHVSRLVAHVLDVPGVAAVRVHRLRRLVPWSAEHAVDGVLPLGPSEVALLVPPYEGVAAGVLTVQVCGAQP